MRTKIGHIPDALLNRMSVSKGRDKLWSAVHRGKDLQPQSNDVLSQLLMFHIVTPENPGLLAETSIKKLRGPKDESPEVDHNAPSGS